MELVNSGQVGGQVYSIELSPDERLVAVASSNKVCVLFVSSLQEKWSLEFKSFRAVFSPDGSKLAVADYRNSCVRICDSETGEELNRLSDYANGGGVIWSSTGVGGVAWSSKGVIATSSDDHTIRLRNLESDSSFQLNGHSDHVWCVAFSPDGTLLASSSRDKTIRIWNVASRECLHTLLNHTQGVWRVAFSPDGSKLISVSRDRTVSVWDASSSFVRLQSLPDGPNSNYPAIAWSFQSELFATANGETLQLWDNSNTSLLSVCNQASAVALSRFSHRIITGDSNGKVVQWKSPVNWWLDYDELNQGRTKDIKVAIRWCREAVENGDERPLQKLKALADVGYEDARDAILFLLKQGYRTAIAALEDCVIKDRQYMMGIILKGIAYTNRYCNTIKFLLDHSLSDPKAQNSEGNTFFMNSLLHLDADVLTEPQAVKFFCDLFNRSPWHAVNRQGRSLAEIIIEDRVPSAIRNHARLAMENSLADPSFDPARRSAAARALHSNDPLLPSFLSSGIPFGNLPIFADDANDLPRFQDLFTAVEESTRRVPQATADQLQSLVDMLHSVNTPEMQNISRLELLLPNLDSGFSAIKETHRWLSQHGDIQANENADTDTLERIQDHRDLLQRHLREMEPILAEVNAILPELDANLSSLFPQIEGRAAPISPTQLNDILIFIRQHFGNISWHQQSVLYAFNNLMDKLEEYSRAARSMQRDLDNHIFFIKSFLAHVDSFCSTDVRTARRQVEEIATIRSSASKSDFRRIADELRTVRLKLQTCDCEMTKLVETLVKKRKALETGTKTLAALRDSPDFIDIFEPMKLKIETISQEIAKLEQKLEEKGREKQALTVKDDELRGQIRDNKLVQSNQVNQEAEE